MIYGSAFTSMMLFDSNLKGRAIEIESTITSFGDKILQTSQILGSEELQHIDFVHEFFDSFFNGMQPMNELERTYAFENLSILQVFRLLPDGSSIHSNEKELLLCIEWNFKLVERYSGLAGLLTK